MQKFGQKIAQKVTFLALFKKVFQILNKNLNRKIHKKRKLYFYKMKNFLAVKNFSDFFFNFEKLKIKSCKNIIFYLGQLNLKPE